MINVQYNSNKGLLEECDKKENMQVTGTAATSCLKRRLNVLSNVTYSASHRWAGAPTTNIQSALTTLPICVKTFHSLYHIIWYQR
jgi:hypothetical protein